MASYRMQILSFDNGAFNHRTVRFEIFIARKCRIFTFSIASGRDDQGEEPLDERTEAAVADAAGVAERGAAAHQTRIQYAGCQYDGDGV